jgi:WD40 repeat protein
VSAPSAAAFSPTGRLLAIGYSSDGVEVWDLKENKVVHRLKGYSGRTIGFSPDCRLLAGMWPGQVHLWNVETEKLIFATDRDFLAFHFSGDSKTLLTAQKLVAERAFTITSRETQTGRVTNETTRPYPLHVAVFSADGEKIAGVLQTVWGAAKNEIAVWRVVDGALLRKVLVPTMRGTVSLAFSPDGWRLAFSYDSESTPSVIDWDLETNTLRAVERADMSGFGGGALAYSPDGRFLVFSSTSSQKGHKPWSIWSISQAKTVFEGSGHFYAISASGQLLCAGGKTLWRIDGAHASKSE